MSRTDKLSIGALSFSQCRCGGTRWVRPLQLRTTHGRTRLATGLRPGWEPSQHSNNTLVDLGPFSVPVFLIKGILELERVPQLCHRYFAMYRSAGRGQAGAGVQGQHSPDGKRRHPADHGRGRAQGGGGGARQVSCDWSVSQYCPLIGAGGGTSCGCGGSRAT